MESHAPTPAPDAAPAILADLIAAGLISHEMIGDPVQLGSETATLRALCGMIGGPVYRIEPFHYAFRLEPGDLSLDLDGGLGSIASEEWTGTLERALQTNLGEDAVWLNATTDLLPEPEAEFDQPLALLRAHGAAVVAGLSAAAPEALAVINAHYAVQTVRETLRLRGEIDNPAERETEIAAAQTQLLDASRGLFLEASRGVFLEASRGLDARLAAIEEAQTQTAAQLEARALEGTALERLNGMLDTVLKRLDAQAETLQSHLAREDRTEARLVEEVAARVVAQLADRLGPTAAPPAAFQETLGLTLAEFLASMEQRVEQVAAARPDLARAH